MTLGGYIACILVSLFIVCLGSVVTVLDARDGNKILAVVAAIVSIGLIVGTWLIGDWYYTSTQKGMRAVKTQESNFGDGLYREVKVYDVEGECIYEYSGEIDIEYDDDRILFDDEEGLRHVIYYPTGNVIITEKKSTKTVKEAISDAVSRVK